MATPSGIWRRRVLLMVVLGLAIAIPATILIRGGDEEDAEPQAATTSTPAEVPTLNPGVEDRGLQVAYQVPKGWNQDKEASAIRLESEDRSVILAVAAPATASASEQVLDDALAAIRSNYRGVEVAPGAGRKVGGLKAKGAVVSAKTAEGGSLRILVAVAKGDKRTYLVEVFTSAAASAERVREAQVALNSLELNG